MNTKHECCSDPRCDVGLKNRYFSSKRITPESFQIEQTYLVERRRLINRATLGWGVVYGFAADIEIPDDEAQPRLVVKSGLALDRYGRELVKADDLPVKLEHIILVEHDKIRTSDDGNRMDVLQAINKIASTLGNGESSCWLLSVHYAEKRMNSVLVSDSCKCERTEWDHTCETIRFSLQSIICDDCCRHEECNWECECRDEACCDPEEAIGRRGGCHCLCEYSKNADVLAYGECERLCEVEEPCGVVSVDLRGGVPLGCLKVFRKGGELGIELDDCGPRRLVKRNDMLFDLIRGCDLTTIKAIGWAKYHRRKITIDELRNSFERVNDEEFISTLFWVEFSRPVRVKTLKPDCFVLTVYFQNQETGWWEPHRVPIARIETTNVPNDDTLATKAAIVIPSDFVEEQSFGYRRIQNAESRIEIEVRGDYIIDCNGQAVDANTVGLRPVPTGNGSPGGTFLSSIRVVPSKPQQQKQ